jgi:RHS repeat-associated protein
MRNGVTEPNGRTVVWNYDHINRLTSETISLDPHSNNGTASYGLDPVGNRLNQNSSLPGIPTGSFTYDANDRLSTETYDNNGNTLTSGARTFVYDFENRLKSMTNSVTGVSATITYDGDGNRVEKTANGTTTRYLVDDLNPTGYAQVIEELGSTGVQRAYTYGLQRINQNQLISGTWTPSFYGYDGFGSVRTLADATGTVTDTYEYDAWGNSFGSTGSTPNVYLYRGEQYDSDMMLYYLRARYLNPLSGRFLTRDPEPGAVEIPVTLHRYLYAGADSVNDLDPTGRNMFETGILTEVRTSAMPIIGGIALGAGQAAVAAAKFAIGVVNYWAGVSYITVQGYLQMIAAAKATQMLAHIWICEEIALLLAKGIDEQTEGRLTKEDYAHISLLYDAACMGIMGGH